MLFGESCNSSDDEFERSNRKKKKEMISKKNKSLVKPTIQKDNRSEGIGHIDLLLSYIFSSSGDNNSDLVSEENDDCSHMLLKAKHEFD